MIVMRIFCKKVQSSDDYVVREMCHNFDAQ
jgi:hypothetical protein